MPYADDFDTAADVGTNGGFVTAGSSAGEQDQQVFWTATAGDDRTRDGFLVVPVEDGSVYLHYEAGTRLVADLVGYVTDGTAPAQAGGLVVPVPPAPAEPVPVPAGEPVDITVIPPGGIAGVPANPTLTAAGGAPRPTVTLVRTVAGAVRVSTEAGASVALSPQAVVLGS